MKKLILLKEDQVVLDRCILESICDKLEEMAEMHKASAIDILKNRDDKKTVSLADEALTVSARVSWLANSLKNITRSE